jgi:hypothetical protein
MNPEYVAGFFDGEGWVGINKCGSKYYAVRVEVSNTNPMIIKEIHEVFGGHLRTKQPRINWKPQTTVRLSAGEAEKFLRWIKPFARMKREHISLALMFIELTNSNKLSVTDKEGFKDKMHLLNRRGVEDGHTAG